MKFDMRALSNPFEGNFFYLCGVIANQYVLKSAQECGIETQNSSLFNGSRPEFGATRLCKMLGKLNESVLNWYHLQTTIASFLSGIIDTIKIKVEVELPVTIGGMTFTETAYYVEGEGAALTVRFDSGDTYRFNRFEVNTDQFIWHCVNSPRKEIRLGTYKTIPVVDPTWINAWDYKQTVYPDSQNCGLDFINEVEDAYTFLQNNCPEYYVWCIALVEEISAISPEISRSLTSQSFSFWPGQIHVSYSDNLYRNLDCIIHENCHLYFNLIEWIEPVCKQNAPPVLSPLKGEDRPLKTILLAYHAIGNLLLLLLKLKRSGVNRQLRNLMEAIDFNKKIVRELESILVENRSFLSESGYQLFKPLQDRLLEVGF